MSQELKQAFLFGFLTSNVRFNGETAENVSTEHLWENLAADYAKYYSPPSIMSLNLITTEKVANIDPLTLLHHIESVDCESPSAETADVHYYVVRGGELKHLNTIFNNGIAIINEAKLVKKEIEEFWNWNALTAAHS